MKAVVFVVVVLILMAILGWITFGRSSDRATISVEMKTIQKDLEHTADAVREATSKGIEEAKEKLKTEAHESVPTQP